MEEHRKFCFSMAWQNGSNWPSMGMPRKVRCSSARIGIVSVSNISNNSLRIFDIVLFFSLCSFQSAKVLIIFHSAKYILILHSICYIRCICFTQKKEQPIVDCSFMRFLCHRFLYRCARKHLSAPADRFYVGWGRLSILRCRITALFWGLSKYLLRKFV